MHIQKNCIQKSHEKKLKHGNNNFVSFISQEHKSRKIVIENSIKKKLQMT